VTMASADRAQVAAISIVQIVRDVLSVGGSEAEARAAVAAALREEFSQIERQVRDERPD
jgi:hypothetical protein